MAYESKPAPSGNTELITHIGANQIAGFDATAFAKALAETGYPKAADPARVNWPIAIAFLVLMMVWATMVYGPMAAFLVEMFPARIRYTSLSAPFHIGNGFFGGFLPFVSFAIVAFTGNPLGGLWYPIIVALLGFAVGIIFIRDRTGSPASE